MNRHQRRALSRPRTPRNPELPRRKQSHFLPQQVCVLYVPDRGYVAGFLAETFRIVEDVEQATPYIDDEASRIGIAFREVTGLRVTIRPYYCPHAAQ